MPAWVTIYLQQRPPELAATTIQREMPMPDWWTLGENFDIDEDEVDAFLEKLVWSDDPLELQYEGRRPIQFHEWTDPERIRTEVAELDERDLQVPDSVREHVRSVQAIIALEMAFTQLETMFEVVAFEIAYWLCEKYRGVILGPNDEWFDHAAHRWEPITS